MLEQLPLSRRPGAAKDEIRRDGAVEHGRAVLLGLLRWSLRLSPRFHQPMAAVLSGSCSVPSAPMTPWAGGRAAGRLGRGV